MDVVQQALSILCFLHSNGIMHRNINPDIFYFNSQFCKLYM
jgi:serine/threonine protein kinase